MKRQELLDDFAGRDFVSRIIVDSKVGTETDIDIHRISFQEIEGTVSIMRSIGYLHNPKTDEAWYMDAEPEGQLAANIERAAQAKIAMTIQSAQLKA